MGFLTDLFGDESERNGLFLQYAGEAEGHLNRGYSEFQSYLQQAQQFLMAERATNLAEYRAEFQRGIGSLESAITAARSGMMGAFTAQRELMAAGFEATKTAIGEQFKEQAAAQAQRNAFTGLGNTTFGQSTLDAVDAEGAKQMGLVDERQRLAQAELEGQQAQIRTSFEMQAGGSLMQARAAFAEGAIGQSQAYAMPYAAMLGQIGQAGMNTYGSLAGLSSGLGQNLAANAGSGFNLGGTLIGSATGGFANQFFGG